MVEIRTIEEAEIVFLEKFSNTELIFHIVSEILSMIEENVICCYKLWEEKVDLFFCTALNCIRKIEPSKSYFECIGMSTSCELERLADMNWREKLIYELVLDFYCFLF